MRLLEMESNLRERLRSCIQHRGKAEAQLARAQQSLDRVRILLLDLAQAEADAAKFESLKTKIAAFKDRANEDRETAAPSGANTEKTALAEVTAAKRVLERELDAAQEEATRAANAVKDVADAIVRIEVEKIGVDLVRTQQEAWRLSDLLNGYFRIDARRPGGPTLLEFQERICAQLNRRNAAISSGRLELRQPERWDAFLNERSAEAERSWVNYVVRLANDPQATHQ